MDCLTVFWLRYKYLQEHFDMSLGVSIFVWIIVWIIRINRKHTFYFFGGVSHGSIGILNERMCQNPSALRALCWRSWSLEAVASALENLSPRAFERLGFLPPSTWTRRLCWRTSGASPKSLGLVFRVLGFDLGFHCSGCEGLYRV